MSNLENKRILSLLFSLLLILSVSLYGCTDQEKLGKGIGQKTENASASQIIEPKGKPIKGSIDIKYTVKNQIELTTITVQDNDFFDYSYLQIKGLKDKAVEKKINEKLKAAYDKMAENKVPPYRGIKAQYPNPGTIYQEYISMHDVGNFNNILSIVINKSTTRTLAERENSQINEKHANEQSWYVSDTETLNIDLNTGNEITLGDVFCNDVDYLTLINSYVSKKLMKVNANEEGYYTLDNLKLVESFKGFKSDCKFAIYDFGINFILDYSTPQFETGFNSSNLFIEYNHFDNKIAITKRFYEDEKNLYESTKPLIKQLQIKAIDMDLNRQDSYKEGNVQIFTSIRNSSRFPKIIQKEINKLSQIDESKIQKMNDSIKTAKDFGTNKDLNATYELMVTTEVVGDYITINKNEYLYSSLEEEMNMPDYLHKTYHLKTLKEVKLEDVFIEGFDFMTAIKTGIDKNQGTLYKKITGVGLSSVGLYLTTEEEQDGKRVHSLCYIPYEDLGCENLTIF